MPTAPARRIAFALAAACLLAGCTEAPRVVAIPTGTTPPPRFPRIAGEVLSTESPVEGEWRIRVRAADTKAAYERAKRTLEEAGYDLTKDREGSDGGDGQACTPRLCVSFTATEDPTWGPSVAYVVFHSVGISAG